MVVDHSKRIARSSPDYGCSVTRCLDLFLVSSFAPLCKNKVCPHRVVVAESLALSAGSVGRANSARTHPVCEPAPTAFMAKTSLAMRNLKGPPTSSSNVRTDSKAVGEIGTSGKTGHRGQVKKR